MGRKEWEDGVGRKQREEVTGMKKCGGSNGKERTGRNGMEAKGKNGERQR